MPSTDEYRDVIGALLPKNWSQDKRDTLADEIVSDLEVAGVMVFPKCAKVEVTCALMPVETVEAYGLTIKLDANGEASEISHPSGLVVLG